MDTRKIMISDASRILGIAPETLRHYEKKHIVHPEKEDVNGYRFFTMSDLCSLSKVRSFMQYGYSIEESHQIVMSENLDRTKELFLGRADAIQKEIAEKMDALQSLYARMNLVHRACDNLGRFSIRQAADYEAIPMFDQQGNLIELSDIHANWINQTVTYPFALLDREGFTQGLFRSIAMGLSVSEEQRNGKLRMNRSVLHIRPGRCVFVCYILDEKRTDPIVQEINQYLADQKLVLRGDILERTVATFCEEGENRFLAEFWVPIE